MEVIYGTGTFKIWKYISIAVKFCVMFMEWKFTVI